MKKKEKSGFLQSRFLWLSFALGVFLFLEAEEVEKVVGKYIPFGAQSPSSAQMVEPEEPELAEVPDEKKREEVVKMQEQGTSPVVAPPVTDEPPVIAPPPPQETSELVEFGVDNWEELSQELNRIRTYVQQNVQYPPEAKRRNIQGIVIVRFVLKKDGTIGEVEVLRGDNLGDGALAEEVIRVLKSTGGWKTAKQRGRPVDVKLTMPITFRLQ
jgi:protein TonB